MENERDSDHSLMEAAKEGDEAAFAEIVARYQGPITNYLYRFLYDYDEAVELAQETFVRIYFALDRYHTRYAFSTYIYRIASNLAISEIRKRGRRKTTSLTGLFQREENKDVEFQPVDEKPVPEDELMSGELKEVLERAISSLPEKYRAAVILRDVEGKSYEEVAGVLELGLGTTKSRISRGRKLLRDKLAGYL